MGRTKGSKNGVRKVPIKKTREQIEAARHKKKTEAKVLEMEPAIVESTQEPSLPFFDPNVLKAYRSKSYEKCIGLIEKILMNNSDENKDHYKILLAASYTMMGQNFYTAHSLLDEVVMSDPHNSFAMYSKGVAFYFEGQISDSIGMLNKAIDVNPGPEMDRAKDMKMRIDLERRSAVIMVEKIEHNEEKVYLDDDDVELPDVNIEDMIDEFPDTIEAIDDCELPEIEAQMESIFEEEPQVLQDRDGNCSEYLEVKGEKCATALVNFKREEQNDEKSSVIITRTVEVTPPKVSNKTEVTSQSTESEAPPDIPESLPKSFKPRTADDFYTKGMELYMCGSLRKSLKMFDKAIKISKELTIAEEMGTKAQELLELMDVAALNMTQKNYDVVVEILNEALEVDVTNNYVNRPFYFQRGLALYHLGKNEASLKDYAEFDRLNKLLNDQ